MTARALSLWCVAAMLGAAAACSGTTPASPSATPTAPLATSSRALATPAGYSTARVPVPLEARLAGQTYADPAVPCPGSPLPVAIVSVMSGPVTHMGLAEMRSQHCIVGQNPDGSLLVSGSAVIRAANGDEIHGTYTGSMYGFSPAPAPGTLMTAGGMMLLAGGTGRFADASGQLAWDVEVRATGTGVEAIQGSLEGSIVY